MLEIKDKLFFYKDYFELNKNYLVKEYYEGKKVSHLNAFERIMLFALLMKAYTFKEPLVYEIYTFLC